jgi:hypothetical protein
MATVDRQALLDVLAPLEEWAAQCHAASLKLVRSGVLPDTARVARGSCQGVFGQHSWVCVEGDCYDPTHTVIDPTLWSFTDEVEGIWIGSAEVRPHIPHGAGSIWEWGQPQHNGGITIPLDREGLSQQATNFLGLIEPLDAKGWAQLAHAPVGGWPSGEILTRMAETPGLGVLIPIDIVGMATDLNPQGLYR